MSKYLNKPVAYLQDSDVDDEGNLINPDIPSDIPVVVILQANFCGYCTQAKPAFQDFANANEGKVFCATVQGDGTEEGEANLSKKLNKMKESFRGYPDYVLYLNGKKVDKEITGRGVSDLRDFAVI
jgi:thiol-disulfide isomerase/thioredoxin